MKNKVRVRFCPSPTGMTHVGLLRTALFNYLFAKSFNGSFVLRIEDTDKGRHIDLSELQIIEDLKWCNLYYNEGPDIGGEYEPYRQSERHTIHQNIIERLFNYNLVYYCDCSKEDIISRVGKQMAYDGYCAFRNLSRSPNTVLRLKVDKNILSFNDGIYGNISIPKTQVYDFVIMRSDSTVLYNFANPVDDALMRITHIIRGQDLLLSTIKQINIYKALQKCYDKDIIIPIFIHLPHVLGDNLKKLSKRDTHSHFMRYKELGFIPEGVTNYLSLLGWSTGSKNIEFMNLDQISKEFNIDKINKSSAIFDFNKFKAINALHLHAMSLDIFGDKLYKYLEKYYNYEFILLQKLEKNILVKLIELIQSRVSILSESLHYIKCFIVSDVKIEKKNLELVYKISIDEIMKIRDILYELVDYNCDIIKVSIMGVIEKFNMNKRNILMGLRVIITGEKISLPLFESIELLGKEKVLSRIDNSLKLLQSKI